jgi:hypothetical protein
MKTMFCGSACFVYSSGEIVVNAGSRRAQVGALALGVCYKPLCGLLNACLQLA